MEGPAAMTETTAPAAGSRLPDLTYTQTETQLRDAVDRKSVV